jgi:hypothetical protein
MAGITLPIIAITAQSTLQLKVAGAHFSLDITLTKDYC